MVLCFIALAIFSVGGIFSAKYRAYAKEAYECVIKKATLRKCDSDFDLRMRAEMVAKLAKVNKGLAAVTNRHFVLLSWIFMLLMVSSFAYSVVSVYNYIQYGNCNGPTSTETCLLDLAATGNNGFTRYGEVKTLAYPPTLYGHVITGKNTRITVMEYGCYACPYTKKAEEKVQKLLDEYGESITFIFKPMPVERHHYAWEAANAAECAAEQGKFWEYKSALFEDQDSIRENGVPELKRLATGLVADQKQFEDCVDSKKYFDKVNRTQSEGKAIGVYGTPTFFVGNRTFVGNVDYDTLKKAVESEMKN